MQQRVKVPRYKVLVVDPPWEPDDKLGKRGAVANYECHGQEWMQNFRLPHTADDCVLLLWRLAIMQEEALQLARGWGFNPTKGEFVWRKMTSGGKEHFGMGHIVRGSHESCIIATKGRPLVLRKNQRSLFSAPVPRRNGKIIHSAKPDLFFEIVASLFDGPRASVFERTPRSGFTCFGNQMEHGEQLSDANRQAGDSVSARGGAR